MSVYPTGDQGFPIDAPAPVPLKVPKGWEGAKRDTPREEIRARIRRNLDNLPQIAEGMRWEKAINRNQA